VGLSNLEIASSDNSTEEIFLARGRKCNSGNLIPSLKKKSKTQRTRESIATQGKSTRDMQNLELAKDSLVEESVLATKSPSVS
jgi:hypothetical protein